MGMSENDNKHEDEHEEADIVKCGSMTRSGMSIHPHTTFLEQLEKNNLEIVWLVDHYRTKNALNYEIKCGDHPMKTRKYLVWYEEGVLVSQKFWDARFNNHRDEVPMESDEED